MECTSICYANVDWRLDDLHSYFGHRLKGQREAPCCQVPAATHPSKLHDRHFTQFCRSGVRSEKLKEEKAATAGKKATKKGSLNVGRSGGTAGLDDYVYDDVGVDEDYDFM